MRFAVDVVLVDFCAEGIADRACRAGKLDELPALRSRCDAKSVRGEPGGGGFEVGIGGAELLAELLRREPLVVAGRAACVGGLQELLQRGLAVRRTVQQKKHSSRGKGIGNRPAVIGGSRQRMHAALQRDQAGLVDRLSD